MMGVWLEQLSLLVGESGLLAPLIAFAAGVLTSFSPCSLSMLPLVIGYVGGGQATGGRAFRLSVVFAFGTAITITVLGVMAATLGHLLSAAGTWWYLIAGIFMILMALQIWEVYNFIPSSVLLGKNKARGYGGALIAGLLSGFFASSCATPILMVLLTIIISMDNFLWSVLLLFSYAVGNGVLIVLLGTSLGLVQKLKQSQRYAAFHQVSRSLMGTLVLLLGLWFLYLGF